MPDTDGSSSSRKCWNDLRFAPSAVQKREERARKRAAANAQSEDERRSIEHLRKRGWLKDTE